MSAPRQPYLNSRPGQAGPHRGLPLRLVLKWAAVAVATAAFIALLAGSWFYWKMKGSLPAIDGAGKIPGLIAAVKVERDALGVPTVTGRNFLDVVRALGYVHGQDRFFQMDLSRRRGAGELAEMFGSSALEIDRRARIHDFRPLAQRALAALPKDQRDALHAYADGVNAGLTSLAVKPFEYVLLRLKPAPWKAEDTLLVSYSLALTFQDDQGQYLQNLHRVRTVLGEKAVDFFSPRVGPMDSALDGSLAPLPPMPGPTAINLRGKISTSARQSNQIEGLRSETLQAFRGPTADRARNASSVPLREPTDEVGQDGDAPGSNSLAIAGPPGTAVLANDIHLSLGLPNTWYRACLVWPEHKITGVTLPGAPVVAAGSNGKIAWGMTVAKVGSGDLILVNTDLPDFYRGPDADELPIKPRTSFIHVKGGRDVKVSTDWTVWGPVVAHGDNNQLVVYRWAMDDPTAVDGGLIKLFDADTVAAGIDVARHSGLSNLNFLVADRAGQIGWTIAGHLPKRVGFTGRWAVLFQYRDRQWDGWIAPSDVPAVTGRDFLWTANQRLLGGAALDQMGDSGYVRGARGAQIRDDLKSLAARPSPAASPRDLLNIELDDRAVFLEWWRDLALRYLERGPARDAVEHDSSRAAVDSKGYRFVRELRDRVARAALDPIFASCAEDDDSFDWSKLNYEPALREILTKKPIHLLDPKYESWDDLVKAQARAQARSLPTWGARNILRVDHPLSRAFPHWLTWWLNLPAVPVPGDTDMPRVQSPSFGASERFAVSPGHEDQGIFEMPGGQSGHPLSPFYTAGTENWLEGKSSPFLPGPAAHTLMLAPE